MSALSLTTWSLPELFVGCFCWAIWFVGLSLKSNDPNTNMVMRSYRLVTLAVNLLLTSFFLAHSGLTPAHQTLWWTYLIATTLPPVAMRFSRKASGQSVVWFEVVYWVISVACALGLLVAPDAFVGQNRMNPLGYPQANSLLLGLALTVVQVVTVTWSVGERFRKNSLGPIGLVGVQHQRFARADQHLGLVGFTTGVLDWCVGLECRICPFDLRLSGRVGCGARAIEQRIAGTLGHA
jgi:hypothetical protein